MTMALQTPAFAQKNCELKKDKENIKVFSCKTPDSRFNTVRGEFEVNATFDDYISIVLDVEKYPEWRYKENSSKVLKKVSDHELIYYTRISPPFPVSDRDLVLRLKIHEEIPNEKLVVTITSEADFSPEVDGVVRIKKTYSTMTLTRLSKTRLKVEYFLEVDPRGSIPAWIVNMFSTSGPFETFKNMRNKMEGKH
jgi:hypothetical protein